jgi:hypothetical protein
MIVGDPEYKLSIGGLDQTQLGSYTLTTEVGHGGDFTCGDFPVMVGSTQFSSQISGGNSCAGTIEFGPNKGQPLIYQGRGAQLEAGKTYTISITGLAGGDEAVALFVAAVPLAPAIDHQLDLGDGVGDTERTVTFTASRSGLYYIEVSNAPEAMSNYTLTLTEN